LKFLKQELGGSIRKTRHQSIKWSAAFSWTLYGASAANLLLDIQPYLKLKGEQAECCIRLQSIIEQLAKPKGIRRKWTQPARQEASELKTKIHELNSKGPTSPVFPQGAIAVRHNGQWVCPQMSLFEETGWESFSGTWPKSGSMRSGVICRRPPLALRTSGSECSSWATPDATAAQRGNGGYTEAQLTRPQGKPSILNYDVLLWPTPNARDSKGAVNPDSRDRMMGQLDEAAEFLFSPPVPVISTDGIDRRDGFTQQSARKRLNPLFTEWLMGQLPGWTNLEPTNSAALAIQYAHYKRQLLSSNLFGEPES